MTDRQTREWMSLARTPRTRARIRAWSRWDDLARGLLLVGGVMFVMSLAVGLWFWIADIDRLGVFFWSYGAAVGMLLVGTFLSALAGSRLSEARFADGRCDIGVIEQVIRLPWDDTDGNPTYELVVSATITGSGAIRRTIQWGSGDSSGPDDRWIGREIRFRHNTLDPDDESDALFDGWPDETDGR